MYLIQPSSINPSFNLALEEYIFECLNPKEDYFMLWQNDTSVIVGKYQNTIEQIHLNYVEEHHIPVVRRLSGGGAVYHDLGNLNFTFITKEEETINFDFKYFLLPLCRVLEEYGVQVSLNHRNDATVDLKKFSGNAQYRKNGRVMHHGTILIDSNLNIMNQALAVSSNKIKSKATSSVHSSVTNLKPYLPPEIGIETFQRKLIQEVAKIQTLIPYYFTQEQLAEIEYRKKNRYDLWEWNFGQSPYYEIVKKRRFENCGQIELHYSVFQGRIKEMAIYGDFFGNRDCTELAQKFLGCKIKKEKIKNVLQGISLQEYIYHLTPENWIELLFY